MSHTNDLFQIGTIMFSDVTINNRWKNKVASPVCGKASRPRRARLRDKPGRVHFIYFNIFKAAARITWAFISYSAVVAAGGRRPAASTPVSHEAVCPTLTVTSPPAPSRQPPAPGRGRSCLPYRPRPHYIVYNYA